MKKLSSGEIRESYLRFFEERGHVRMASDSLVPANDKTLLFTGAGMNQFKDMFLGLGNLPHKRVTTAQKCLRVPDLENVGQTPRHHTFFEMLGNFSFGDYFKQDCIGWVFSWFTETLGIPRERLVVSIYEKDDEAHGIWRNIVGVPEERIYRFGEDENFWPANAPSKGPNGPCGPCSEVFYDYRPQLALPRNDGLESLPDERFSEIGNCVFTQFDRQEDGSLLPLPQKNIDVGLGFERIVSVLQGATNNFETDLFLPYLDYLGRLMDREDGGANGYGEDPAQDIRMRRVADHIRAVAFLIADGVRPSNEGRGYVVRKILRRACRDSYGLGLNDPFLHGLAAVVGEVMGEAYPELIASEKQIKALVHSEELAFRQIYVQGMERFDVWFTDLGDPKGWPRQDVPEGGRLPVPPASGSMAFELHDTFGFPVDITRQLLLDHGYALDEPAFAKAMEAQRHRARESSQIENEVFALGFVHELKERAVAATEFCGYEDLICEAKIQALCSGKDEVQTLHLESRGELVATKTPFYAEAGGQVGDCGLILGANARAYVSETREQDGFYFHTIEVSQGEFTTGDSIELFVDIEKRSAIERNHTATHLLHQALKDVLGEHVSQSGSLVAPERLRFDYTQNEKLTTEQLAEIETIVNREIMTATTVLPVSMGLDEARAHGFVALFGEKYGNVVRTLSVGSYSKELCGGTHVDNSGNISQFRILSDSSIAAGVRRIEAVTGYNALFLGQQDAASLAELCRQLKTPKQELVQRIQGLQSEIRNLRKALDQNKKTATGETLDGLLDGIRERCGATLLVAEIPGAEAAELLDLSDRLRKKFPSFAGVLFGVGGKGVPIVAAASKDLVKKGLSAGKVLKELATTLGGGGGGRPDVAQGKGKRPEKLKDAVKRAWELLESGVS